MSMTMLDAWMKDTDLSTRELAERAGVNLVTVYRWRAGKKRIAPLRALELARTIGVPAHITRPDLFSPSVNHNAAHSQLHPEIAST